MLSAKIILQRIWREELGWDDALPEKILEDWKAWSSHLTAVENLILSRCLLGTVANPTSRTLHVFTDASEAGFGAIGYLRVRNEDGVDVNFVIAKTRVAPIKFLSIQWVNSKRFRFQTFVANRISEILEKSTCDQWRHVPGILNPADDCSRGISAQNLTHDHPWFN